MRAGRAGGQRRWKPIPALATSADGTAQAQVLIPHSQEVQLESATVSKDFLAVFTRRGGLQVSRERSCDRQVAHYGMASAVVLISLLLTWLTLLIKQMLC